MNARFLGTFCAVARFGSLNAAARHLGLSSASVSEQIKALYRRPDELTFRARGCVLS